MRIYCWSLVQTALHYCLLLPAFNNHRVPIKKFMPLLSGFESLGIDWGGGCRGRRWNSTKKKKKYFCISFHSSFIPPKSRRSMHISYSARRHILFKQTTNKPMQDTSLDLSKQWRKKFSRKERYALRKKISYLFIFFLLKGKHSWANTAAANYIFSNN